MGNIFLGNDSVSGTGIRYDLNATSLTFAWKNMMQIEQEPGKSMASGFNIRMPAHRYNGHEAPVISVNGIIDTSLAPGINSYLTGSVGIQINVGALGSLVLVGSGYFYYPMINTFVSKLPLDTSSATTPMGGSVPVIINNANLIPDLQSMKAGSEYLINYNMQLTIVSGLV